MCELFREQTTIKSSEFDGSVTLNVSDLALKVKRRPSFPNDPRWAVFCPLLRSSPGVQVLPNMVISWSMAVKGVHLQWIKYFFPVEYSGGLSNETRDQESGCLTPAEMSCIPFETGRCILNLFWNSRQYRKHHFGYGGISTVLQIPSDTQK